MAKQVEPLEIQPQRARAQRDARFGISLGLMAGLMQEYPAWRDSGWHWWFLPFLLFAVGLGWGIARLQGYITERAIRWLWRSPR